MCHLPVFFMQPIYLSESERKSDGQWEQAVSPIWLLSDVDVEEPVVSSGGKKKKGKKKQLLFTTTMRRN